MTKKYPFFVYHMRMELDQHHPEDGFTLAELLVTIAILGVLLAIVTIALGGLGNSAESDICNAELVQIL